ncbi:MAG: glycosyltransferase family 9 protein [Acidobacteriota bacterium]
MSTGARPAEDARILLIRTSALGDVVHALPVLTALRRALPRARLGWVVESGFAPLLEDHPDLDEILRVDLRSWRKSLFQASTRHEISKAKSQLRDFRADVALDLMGNHKGGALAWLSGARRRIGLRRADRREPSSAVWLNEHVVARGRHAVERALAVLAPLGVSVDSVDFGGQKILSSTPPEAALWIDTHPEPFAFLHPGAAWANKRYPPESWGAAAAALGRSTGLRIVVGAGPGEEELAACVAANSEGHAIALSAPSLAFLVTLMRRARIVLGGDTGPLHLARALGTRTVMVMGPTDPALHGPYLEPLGSLSHVLPCSYCYKRLPETKSCLLAIPPRQVAEWAVRRLAE